MYILVYSIKLVITIKQHFDNSILYYLHTNYIMP